MPTPTATKTTAGADLPLVALPQDELLTVNADEAPWLEETLAPGVSVKPLRLDLEAGVWVILAKFRPGSRVPLHYHTGEAEVFTQSGRWNYVEYPDQPQTAGSYLYEPAGSVHTLEVPADNTEDTVMLVRVRGANVNFNDDGTFHSILDAAALVFLTELFAQQLGLDGVAYITGGDAAVARAGTGTGTGEDLALPASIAEALET